MKKFLVGLIAVIVIATVFFGCNFLNFNDHSAQITVTDKERINEGDSSKYLIMGEDENGNTVVYENTDIIWRGKFDSSTFYADMEIGKTYDVVLVGARVPIFSWYENIVSYEEIK